MNISTTGLDFIKGFETLHLKVYGDPSGYPTVGWGHLLSYNVYDKNKDLSTASANRELKNAGFSYTSPITKSQANSILNKDLKKAVNAVNAKNDEVYNKLTQNQYDALVSLAFNAGTGVLHSDDMSALLNRSMTFIDYGAHMSDSELKTMAKMVTAAFQYTKSGGVQLRGLVNRRNKEMELFCTGMRYSYNKIIYKG